MARLRLAAALLLVALLGASAENTLSPTAHVPSACPPYYTPDIPGTSVSIQQVGLAPSSPDLPFTDPRIANGDPNLPDEISIAYQSPTEVIIGYVTGAYLVVNQATPLTPQDPSQAPPTVCKFGTSSSSLTSTSTGSASQYTYFYNSTGKPNFQYRSGFIHYCTLAGLNPATQYFYQVGDGASHVSNVLSFKTLQPLGPQFNPYRISIFADVGQTSNSSVTVDHMVQSNSDLVWLIADYSYADDHCSDGTDNCSGQTYQPKWDFEFRLLQPLLSKVPHLGICGNHEIETQGNGLTFQSFLARTRYPTNNPSGNGVASNTQFYYSVDIPGAHLIWLDPYVPYVAGTPQYNFVLADLAAVDRTVTPWLFVLWHPPLYSTYTTHFKEQECFRETYEDIFYQNGVDAIFHGHVHAYERNNRVYNYNIDCCAPFYITIGDAGNIEGLYKTFADDPGFCGSVPQPQCATLQNGSYCQSSQPEWSAFREPSFGHGTLDMTPNSATWTWHRNQDSEATVSDQFVFTRAPSSICPNRALPAGQVCDNINNLNGQYPNQCFNADGTFSACCAGGCPAPGPIPYCAGNPEPLPGGSIVEGQQYPRYTVTPYQAITPPPAATPPTSSPAKAPSSGTPPTGTPPVASPTPPASSCPYSPAVSATTSGANPCFTAGGASEFYCAGAAPQCAQNAAACLPTQGFPQSDSNGKAC